MAVLTRISFINLLPTIQEITHWLIIVGIHVKISKCDANKIVSSYLS